MEPQEHVLSKGRRLGCRHIVAAKARVHQMQDGRWLCFSCAINEHVDEQLTNQRNITRMGLEDTHFVRRIHTYPAERVFAPPPRNRWRAFVDYLMGA